jgi:hypothetical protein
MDLYTEEFIYGSDAGQSRNLEKGRIPQKIGCVSQ